MSSSKQNPKGGKQAPGSAGPKQTSPLKQTAAQKRLAAQRAMAAANGVAAARRRRLLSILLPILAVVVVVGVLVIVKATTKSSKPENASAQAGTGVVAAVTGVPASVFDSVGVGSTSTPPKAVTGTPLTAGGLPRVLYVGAEWCPFCAAERWPLAVALSRFGTFTGLGQTASSPNDVYPNTPTLTFYGAKYTSKYISFTGAEIENGSKQTLATLSPADETLFTKTGGGSFPFVDIGGKYLVTSAQYDPQLLHGKTHAQVASALSDPSSSIGKAVIGSANTITASICASTNNQPANVCTSSGVVAAAKKLS